jgi:hypothetical protein
MAVVVEAPPAQPVLAQPAAAAKGSAKKRAAKEQEPRLCTGCRQQKEKGKFSKAQLAIPDGQLRLCKECWALEVRIAKDAPFGHCPRGACQAALKPKPPRPPSNYPLVACPRWKRDGSGPCKEGYIRQLGPGEFQKLPKAFKWLEKLR